MREEVSRSLSDVVDGPWARRCDSPTRRNLAEALNSVNPDGVGVPDGLAPFHLASADERSRRVREVLVRAWAVYRRGDVSLTESINEAAQSSVAGEYAKISLRRILLELSLENWEQHPNRRRDDVHKLFKRAIFKLTPHQGGWRSATRGKTWSQRERITTREQLLAHVFARCSPEPNTGCWLWTGAEVHGYARMSWGAQKSATVTRLLLGLTPEDAREALHECDNPPCCNPGHLRAGTHAENQADMRRRGRSKAGRHRRRNGAS